MRHNKFHIKHTSNNKFSFIFYLNEKYPSEGWMPQAETLFSFAPHQQQGEWEHVLGAPLVQFPDWVNESDECIHLCKTKKIHINQFFTTNNKYNLLKNMT